MIVSSGKPALNATEAARRPTDDGLMQLAILKKSKLTARPSMKPIADHWAGAYVVDQAQTVLSEHLLHRVRVVRSTLKYPLVQVEDVLSDANPSGEWKLVRQLAMAADHVLVKRQPDVDEVSFRRALAEVGASVMTEQHSKNVYLVSTPAGKTDSLAQALAGLWRKPGLFAVAEPDWIGHASVVPNDGGFVHQWGLHNAVQTSGAIDADIDAPEAWSLFKGSRSVIVAILDSGMAWTHGDLAANLWTNPGDSSVNKKDDDTNGYTDDVHGWDFYNHDANPLDDEGHGTHVAGIIGASGNNATGVAGVCWNVTLMPLKWLGKEGDGFESDAIEALNYAVKMGADVTNNSWGGFGFSALLQETIDSAGQAGVAFVSASGNEGLNLQNDVDYPGCYPLDCIINVAASTNKDGLAYYSNYGPQNVDIAAPGDMIYSTLPGTYGYESGTSMAAPMVAGAYALLKGYRPTLSMQDIRSTLLTTADKVPGLIGKTASGRLNLHQALLKMNELSLVQVPAPAITRSTDTAWTATEQRYTIRNYDLQSTAWSVQVDVPWLDVSANSGQTDAGGSTALVTTLNGAADGLTVGSYAATIQLQNLRTGVTQTQRLVIEVLAPIVVSLPLDTNPNWTTTGQWAFGAPSGSGGAYVDADFGRAFYAGGPDPTSGATGANVLGVALAGDYDLSGTGPFYLTSPPYDFSSLATAQLRFQRWLNIEGTPFGTATVEVYQPGRGWVVLWKNGEPETADKAWTPQVFDITSYAAGRKGVQFRWSYGVPKQKPPYDQLSWPYSGWNIDDIEVRGLPKSRLYFDAVPAMKEGQKTPTLAVLRITPTPSTAVTVALQTSGSARLTVPASITIPAKATYVRVPLMPVDDALRNGSATLSLQAFAAGYTGLPTTLRVDDNESATLTLSLPARIQQGASDATASVQLAAPVDRATRVTLTSSVPNRLELPSAVVIEAGQNSTTFTIRAPIDSASLATLAIKVTATLTGLPVQTRTVLVDAPSRSLRLTFKSPTVGEGDGTLINFGTVFVNTTATADTTVTLTSSAPDQATVPASVIIKKGNDRVSFPLTAIDDKLRDGTVSVTITATLATVGSASAEISLSDNDPASFTFSVIPSPQSAGTGIPLLITATGESGDVVTAFREAVHVTAGSGSATVPVTLSGPANFTDGRWLGSVSVATAQTQLVLTNTSASRATGSSNAFDVGGAALTTLPADGYPSVSYSASRNKLYAITSTGGRLLEINPATSATERYVQLPSPNTNKVIVSENGEQLYVALNSSTSVVRVSLTDLQVQETRTITARDMCALPGSPGGALVVTTGPYYWQHNGVALLSPGAAPVVIPAQANEPVIDLVAPGTQAGQIIAIGGSPNSNTQKLHVLSVTGNSYSFVSSEPTNGYASTAGLSTGGGLAALSQGHVIDLADHRLLGTINPNNGAVTVVEPVSKRVLQLGYDRITAFESGTVAPIGEFITGSGMIDSQYSGVATCGPHYLAITAFQKLHIIRTDLLPAPDEADLRLLATPVPAIVGDRQPGAISYEIRNDGLADATQVRLWCRLPPGTVCEATGLSQGTANVSTSECTMDLGTIPVRNAAVVWLRVTNSGTAPLAFEAMVSTATPEIRLSDNIASTQIPRSSRSIVPQLDLKVSDIAFDPTHERLYAAVPNTAPAFANSVIELDPVTLQPKPINPVRLNQPRLLTPVPGSDLMHVGALNSKAIARINWGTRSTTNPQPLDGALFSGLNLTGLAALPAEPEKVLCVNSIPIYSGRTLSVFHHGTRLPDRLSVSDLVTFARMDRTDDTPFVDDVGNLYGIATTITGLRRTTPIPGTEPSTTGHSTPLLHMNGRLYADNHILDAATFESRAWFPGDLPEWQLWSALPFDIDPRRDCVYALSASEASGTIKQCGGATGEVIATATFKAKPTDDANSDVTMQKLVCCGQRALVWLDSKGRVYSLSQRQINPPTPVLITLPEQLSETDGVRAAAGLVHVDEPQATPLTLQLQSSQPALLRVPATVTIPAGSTQVNFDIEVVDNNQINGRPLVSVSATSVDPVTVLAGQTHIVDDETTLLTLTLNSAFDEGTGPIPNGADVGISSPAGTGGVIVSLVSSDTSRLRVPVTVTIPEGSTHVSVPVTLPNDTLLDGGKTVTLTASVGLRADASASTQVQDTDAHTLTLSTYYPSTTEGNGFSTTIRLSARTARALAITLNSSKADRMPAITATIPAGATSVEVPWYTLDNTVGGDTAIVSLSASADGFTSNNIQVTIRDNEIASAQWTSVPSNASVNAFFDATVLFKTLDGDPAGDGPTLTCTWEADGTSGSPTHSGSSSSSGGRWSSSVWIQHASAAMRLRITTSTGFTTLSPPFAVSAGDASSLSWQSTPDSAVVGQPFVAKLSAVDLYNNATASYTGTVALKALTRVQERQSGTGSQSSSFAPYYGNDSGRIQFIIPAADLGGAGMLNALSVQLQTSNSTTWPMKIRLKHVSQASFPASGATWDNTNLTQVFAAPFTFVGPQQWITFPFDQSFSYDGVSNLLVEFSFTAWTTSFASSGINASSTGYSTYRALTFSGKGDPLTWTNADQLPFRSYSTPNVRIGYGELISLSPTSATITNGQSVANYTLNTVAPDIRLSARSGAMHAVSRPIQILAPGN